MSAPRYVAKKVGDQYVMERQPDADSCTCGTCAMAGAAISVLGLKRGGLLGKLALLGGGLLIYRGFTGRNPLEWLLRSPAAKDPKTTDAKLTPSYPHDHQQRSGQLPADGVDEASMESFPASDPPARHLSAAS